MNAFYKINMFKPIHIISLRINVTSKIDLQNRLLKCALQTELSVFSKGYCVKIGAVVLFI